MGRSANTVLYWPVALGLDGGNAVDLMGGIKVATGHAHAEITAHAFYNAAIAAFAVRRGVASAFIGLQALAALGFKAGIAASIATTGNARKAFQSAGCAFTFAIITDIALMAGQTIRILAAQYRCPQALSDASGDFIISTLWRDLPRRAVLFRLIGTDALEQPRLGAFGYNLGSSGGCFVTVR